MVNAPNVVNVCSTSPIKSGLRFIAAMQRKYAALLGRMSPLQ